MHAVLDGTFERETSIPKCISEGNTNGQTFKLDAGSACYEF